jgi:hypothetical protein
MIVWKPRTPFKRIESYIIDSTAYNNVKKEQSVIGVFNKYFASIDLPRNEKMYVPKYDKFHITEIRAVIVFLIENNIYVYQDSSYPHAIYVLPDGIVMKKQ